MSELADKVINTDAYKQVIIVRKDLGMSPGKLAAQVSHASMAFLTNMIRTNAKKTPIDDETGYKYESILSFDSDMYEGWILGSYTKVTLGARNKNQILKAIEIAKELGMEEGKDFFLIKDNCYTELTPEEIDENGVGKTLTCVGFQPMKAEVIDQIGKKYHIYNG